MLKNAVEFYQCILDNLTGGLVTIDLEGKVIYLNPMAGQILHCSIDHQCVDSHYSEAFSGFPAIVAIIKDALESGKTVRRAEVSIMHADIPFILGYSTMRVKNHAGEELGISIIFQNLSFKSGQSDNTKSGNGK